MSYKIAIVEDVHSIANMYKTKLQNMGYDTRVAYNGKQGLVLVEEIKPDLLLLDFMMPELDGAELLEIIRSKSWGKDIKVIMLSNVSREEMPPIFGKLNVEDYIMKADYTPSQIAKIVSSVLDK
jgi:DNA-binding response OmpR family regulator